MQLRKPADERQAERERRQREKEQLAEQNRQLNQPAGLVLLGLLAVVRTVPRRATPSPA